MDENKGASVVVPCDTLGELRRLLPSIGVSLVLKVPCSEAALLSPGPTLVVLSTGMGGETPSGRVVDGIGGGCILGLKPKGGGGKGNLPPKAANILAIIARPTGPGKDPRNIPWKRRGRIVLKNCMLAGPGGGKGSLGNPPLPPPPEPSAAGLAMKALKDEPECADSAVVESTPTLAATAEAEGVSEFTRPIPISSRKFKYSLSIGFPCSETTPYT